MISSFQPRTTLSTGLMRRQTASSAIVDRCRARYCRAGPSSDSACGDAVDQLDRIAMLVAARGHPPVPSMCIDALPCAAAHQMLAHRAGFRVENCLENSLHAAGSRLTL